MLFEEILFLQDIDDYFQKERDKANNYAKLVGDANSVSLKHNLHILHMVDFLYVIFYFYRVLQKC